MRQLRGRAVDLDLLYTSQRWSPVLRGADGRGSHLRSVFRCGGGNESHSCKKKKALFFGGVHLTRGGRSARLPHSLVFFLCHGCSEEYAQLCLWVQLRSMEVPRKAPVRSPTTGFPANRRSAADPPPRQQHRRMHRCGQSSCRRLSSARSAGALDAMRMSDKTTGGAAAFPLRTWHSSRDGEGGPWRVIAVVR